VKYSPNKFDFFEVMVAVTEDGSEWALALETRRVAKGARGHGPPGPTEGLALEIEKGDFVFRLSV